MSSQPIDPIQEQLIAARRTQILDAATKVFAEKGVHRATIKEIARVAGIADGTIYNYFANKDALLLGILDRANQSQQRAEHFASGAESDVAQFTRMYVSQRLGHLTDTGLDIFRVLISELLTNPMLRQDYYQQVIAPTFAIADPYFAEWAAQGVVHTSDPRLANRAMAGMVLGLLLLHCLGDSYLRAHWEDVPNVVADFVIHGLSIREGDNHEPSTPAEPAESGEPNV